MKGLEETPVVQYIEVKHFSKASPLHSHSGSFCLTIPIIRMIMKIKGMPLTKANEVIQVSPTIFGLTFTRQDGL